MSEITAEMIGRGRSAEGGSVARRRQVAARIQETREKLTSPVSGPRAFNLELLRVYAAARKRASVGLILLAIAVGGTMTLWDFQIPPLLWSAATVLVVLLGHQVATRFLQRTQADTPVHSWRRRFAASEILQSIAWGSLMAVPADPSDLGARTFIVAILVFVSAMTATITATVPAVIIGSLVPIAVATLCVWPSPSSAQALLIATVAIGAEVYFAVLAHRLHSTTLASLSFRMEKEALIAELEQAKANSDEARRRAEEANLAKSRFLATMSHELRTPLNAILGFSEVMENELFGPHTVPVYRDYANDIHASGQHLLMLINEILDLSRVEAGRYDLKEEPVSLADVVDDCRHLLSLRAKNRSLTVTEAIEPALPRLWADERAVRQITLNLLSNAIKFTPQGGSVTIKVGWTQGGGQYLAIRDTGPGIPEDELPVVMSSFGRGSLAQKNADEGTGLGLPIVKGLVELHGGTFTLTSVVREGTEVVVVFPPERVMDALPQIFPEKPPGSEPKTRSRHAA